MRRITWWIALGAAASAVAGAVLLRPPSPEGNASTPPLPARAGEAAAHPGAGPAAAGGDLRLQVALLRAEVAALRAQVEASQAPARAAPPSETPAERTAGDPVAREVATVAHLRHMQEVAVAYAAEPTDAGWAASTRGLVQAALAADEGTRALVREVDCRSRSCRVELSDDGSGALSKSLPLIVQRLGTALPSAEAEQSETTGGGARVVLYLSRADASSPGR